MAVNHRFHSLVQELAGNKVLSQVIDGLRQKILLYRYRQIYQPNRLQESMQEHRGLQQAFREEKPDAGRSVHAGASDPAVLGAENRFDGGIESIRRAGGIGFLPVTSMKLGRTPSSERKEVPAPRVEWRAAGVCGCPTVTAKLPSEPRPRARCGVRQDNT